MQKRIMVTFPDGEKTYAWLDTDGDEPSIVMAGMPYDMESFAATGATVVVNERETLKVLLKAGVSARPSGKQSLITISVPEEFKERINTAAKKQNRTVTSVLTEAGEKWLEKYGL